MSFSWVAGLFPSETSFELFDGTNASVYTGSGSSMTDGMEFFSLDNACIGPDTTPVIQYTVTLNTADPTMGSVSPAGATTVDAGASFTATATANAGYLFSAWTDGSSQVSTANPYTFTVTGDITLTATFESEPVVCEAPTDLQETGAIISVSLYPNPAEEVVNVQCTMNNVQLGGELILFDVYGKLLQIVPITSETTQINISGLADGMYFVRVTTDEGAVTKTFVKR